VVVVVPAWSFEVVVVPVALPAGHELVVFIPPVALHELVVVVVSV
jgi:hypothetical protein